MTLENALKMAIEISVNPAIVQKALCAVIAARAEWVRVDGIYNATKAEILSENDFCEEESGQCITNPIADYLMSDTDFKKYCELVYVRNCGKGLDSGGVGLNFWPTCKAVYDAEDALIDVVTADIPEYTPEIVRTVKGSPKLRMEFLKIIGL